MQRDFNNLDKAYANAAAERAEAVGLANKQVNKSMRYGLKQIRKGRTDFANYEAVKNDKHIQKHKEKYEKYAKKAQLNDKQMKEMEALQMRIIGHAAQKGYTVKSKPVLRAGTTQRQRAMANMSMIAVGGAIGGAIGGGILGANSTFVNGQKVKISKKGDGSTTLVNYHDANHPPQKKQRHR